MVDGNVTRLKKTQDFNMLMMVELIVVKDLSQSYLIKLFREAVS